MVEVREPNNLSNILKRSKAGTERSGRGPVLSRQEIKDALGRGSVRHVKHKGSHIGENPNPTEWEASKRIGKGEGPTAMEMEEIKRRFPGDYKFMKNDLGLSDKEIYDKLG